jgi:hypothetical protein
MSTPEIEEFDLGSYKLELLPVDDIVLAPYQRNTDPHRVAKIAIAFDWLMFDPIKVSYRDGRFHAVDGGHRLAVLKLLGVKYVPAVVIKDLIYRQEARIFVGTNNRKTVKPIKSTDEFGALYEAGNPEVMGISECLGVYGLKAPKDITCTDTLRSVYDMYGHRRFSQMVGVVRYVHKRPIPSWVIKAVAMVLDEFSGRVDLSRLAEVIADNWLIIDQTKRMETATYNRGILGGAEVILRFYNKNLRRDNRLHF